MLDEFNEILEDAINAHEAKDFQLAALKYSKILEKDGCHPDANHNFGLLCIEMGLIDEALIYLQTAINANPKVLQFWISFANALTNSDRLADARSVIDQAHSFGFTDPILENLSSNIDLKAIDREGQTDSCQSQGSVVEFTQTGTKRLQSANSEHSKEVNKAIATFEHQFEPAESNISVIDDSKLDQAIELAKSNAKKGQIKQAEAIYKEVLLRYPGNKKAIDGVKELHRTHSSKNAKSNNPPSRHSQLLMNLYNKGQYANALNAAVNLLEDFPNSETLHYIIASSNVGLGNLDEAIKAFDKVGSRRATAQALECTYALKNYDDFNERVSLIASEDKSNIRVAAMSAFAAQQTKQEDFYPFCKEPLSMVSVSNISDYLPYHSEFLSELLHELNNIDSSWEPLGKTTKGGFQTNNKLLFEDSPNIQVLRGIIEKELLKYKTRFSKYNDEIIKSWPNKIELMAWYNKLLKGGHQASHIHPSGWISGVLYIKTVPSPEKREGAIKFGLHGYNYPIIDQKYPTRFHQPENGDLVLFPSSLFHETIPVIQEVERCVVAFDLVPCPQPIKV